MITIILLTPMLTSDALTTDYDWKPASLESTPSIL